MTEQKKVEVLICKHCGHAWVPRNLKVERKRFFCWKCKKRTERDSLKQV